MSSYLVLARKYRPRTFGDLVGQEQVSRTLQNALAGGRVAHAYLFSGPRGVGKTTAARLLAMALSCLEEDVAKRPCGHCQNCLEIQAGQAVDVIEVDGASNRGIDDIRDLRETVKYLPAKSRYKVYIIDEVHALTGNAFNALLKTLEEPPSHVVFIFATTETHKVLPTILSRCQRYDFRRIRVEDITGRLKEVAALENMEADEEALSLIARQADGGLRDSLSLMDQIIAAGGGRITMEAARSSLGLIDQDIIRGVALETLAGNASEALEILGQAYLKGYDFKDLGLKVLEHIRALALIKVNPQNAVLMDLTEAEEKYLNETGQKFSLENINQHFDAWLKFQGELSRHPQPRWLMEAQVIRLSQLAPMISLAELAGRLEKLLAQNPPPRPAPSAVLTTPATSSKEAFQNAPAGLNGKGHKASEEAAPSPSLSAGGRADNWADFWRQFSPRLDVASLGLLKAAEAEIFAPEKVLIRFKKQIILGDFIKKNLRAALMPLLLEALGQEPELAFESQEGAMADDEEKRAWALEKLRDIKQDPNVMKLMEKLLGEFVEYRALENQPEEEAEEESALEAAEAENGPDEAPGETEEDA